MFVTGKLLTINGIKTALEYGRQLSILTVMIWDEVTVDLNDYISILNLAESRCVKVTIYIPCGIIDDVPADLLEMNEKWLNVKIDSISNSEMKRRFFE